MAALSFSHKAAKAEVAAAIQDIERATSAEVVVALRPASGHYRHTDYIVGFALSFVTLLVFLFDSHEFSIDWMPVDTLAAFALGSVASAFVPPLRRSLTSRSLMRKNVATAARSAFVELGVTRTSSRSGMLVFVSMFERRVEIVSDIGIDTAVLGPAFADALRALEGSLCRGDRFQRFVLALRALGPILGNALPRRADDVNELPDELST